MKRVLIILAVVLVVIFGGGVMLIGSWVRGVQAQAALWNTEKVDKGEIVITVNATGSVAPIQVVQVGSQVSGKVNAVNVTADQRVKKGQILAVLDTELLESELKDRQNQLKHERIALDMLAVERENLNLRERDSKLNLERQKVEVDRSQGSLDLATKNLQRYYDLIKADATTPTELDIKELEHRNADLDMKGKKLDQERLEMEILKVAAERKSLAAREEQTKLTIAQAEQAVAKAETNLGYASLLAPIDGIVLERAVEPGQTIAAQFQTPNLFKIIADLSTVRIESNIDEADVGRIRAGMKVTFEVDTFRNEKFEGVVKAVNLRNEMKSNLVTYPVVIEAQNPPSEEFPFGKLRPGMTAYVTFEVERRKDVVRVPAGALRFAPPEGISVDHGTPAVPAEKPAKDAPPPKGMPATVYVSQPQGELKAAAIRVGANDNAFYELLSGDLKPGDELVTGSLLLNALKPKAESE
ncbi:MAG: efflux RND transporter periplasmic adaptor subunit [Planctomycetes bacterium]|nr:efflux RND transporter periplasmic adaptor subunit [Planctomycetota bacterium]